MGHFRYIKSEDDERSLQTFNIVMKSDRSLRSITSHFKPKHSNSPTLTSTYSEKGFWSKSYKNQPFPKELKRRLIGHKFKFSDFSDEEEDSSPVVVEEEEVQVLKKKKMLPHVTIMSDRGQFYDSRSRIKSERKAKRGSSREKSVESLKLPQVMEEKKEEDELQKLQRARVSEVKDKNEFNQRCSRKSEKISVSQHSRESLEMNHFSSAMPERIIENEAEETKSQKLKRDKSQISSELQKIIVDEVDDKKPKKEESYEQISQIIEEQRQEEQTENVNKLRISLEKIQQQNSLLNKFMDEELRVPHREERPIQECAEDSAEGHQNSSLSEEEEREDKNVIRQE